MISRINLCSWILITRLDIKGKLGNRVSKKVTMAEATLQN